MADMATGSVDAAYQFPVDDYRASDTGADGGDQ